jgi:hypothetical protein
MPGFGIPGEQRVQPGETWRVDHGPYPRVHQQVYFGPRNPNAIGSGGLMGQKNHWVRGEVNANWVHNWRRVETTSDWASVLIKGEKTWRWENRI